MARQHQKRFFLGESPSITVQANWHHASAHVGAALDHWVLADEILLEQHVPACVALGHGAKDVLLEESVPLHKEVRKSFMWKQKKVLFLNSCPIPILHLNMMDRHDCKRG